MKQGKRYWATHLVETSDGQRYYVRPADVGGWIIANNGPIRYLFAADIVSVERVRIVR